jgi:hypothetical protein
VTCLVYTFAAALDESLEPVPIGRDSLELGQSETGSERVLEISPSFLRQSQNILPQGYLIHPRTSRECS